MGYLPRDNLKANEYKVLKSNQNCFNKNYIYVLLLFFRCNYIGCGGKKLSQFFQLDL